MRTMLVLFALGCAPPPEISLSSPQGEEEPSIEILYPEPGQQVELEPGCVLTVPIIVYVQNFALVPTGEVLPTEGHWHGGPDLDEGYCKASVAYCEGGGEDEEEEEDEGYTHYDGTGRSEGPLNLYVSLHTSDHSPLGVEDVVEIDLVPPDGEACP
jgi:hypothetical protein